MIARAATNDPAVKEQIAEVGAEPIPMRPDEFAAFIRSEIAKWAKVVAESGAKAQ